MQPLMFGFTRASFQGPVADRGQVTECYEQAMRVILWGVIAPLSEALFAPPLKLLKPAFCQRLLVAATGLARPSAAQLVSKDLFWIRHYLNETARRRHSFRSCCCSPLTTATPIGQSWSVSLRSPDGPNAAIPQTGGRLGVPKRDGCSRSSDRSLGRN